jgi:hypothetical protein
VTVCPHCGTNNSDGRAECSLCGRSLPAPKPIYPAQSPVGPGPWASGAAPVQPVDGAPKPGWQTSPVSYSPSPHGGDVAANRSPLPQFGALAGYPARVPSLAACGVCGAPLAYGQAKCSRCETPPAFIVNPNDPTASGYIPFGPHVRLIPLFRAGEDRSNPDPESEVRGWNWAAALLPTLWAARHRLRWPAVASGLLTLLLIGLFLLRAPLHRTLDATGTLSGFLVICALLFGIPRSLFFGLRGSTLAWRSGLYPDRERLRKTQGSWTVWAIIGVTVLALLLGIAGRLLGPG